MVTGKNKQVRELNDWRVWKIGWRQWSESEGFWRRKMHLGKFYRTRRGLVLIFIIDLGDFMKKEKLPRRGLTWGFKGVVNSKERENTPWIEGFFELRKNAIWIIMLWAQWQPTRYQLVGRVETSFYFGC